MNTLMRLLGEYRQWGVIHLMIIVSLWAALWLVSFRIPYFNEVFDRHFEIKEYQSGLPEKLKTVDSLSQKLAVQNEQYRKQQFNLIFKNEEMLSWLRQDLNAYQLHLVAFNGDKNNSPKNNELINLIDLNDLKELKAYRGVLEIRGDFAKFIEWTGQLNQRRLPLFIQSFQANKESVRNQRTNNDLWQNKVLVEWYAK